MSVEVEIVESVLRVFDHGNSDSLDPFKATGTVHYHGDVAIASAFHGNLSAKDVLSIYRLCHDAGARWLLAHRKDGHTIPMGKLMPEGPFCGWWCVDLASIKYAGKSA